MRLRYMYLPELAPLEEIRIRFGYEPVLGRACAIHFVVGVNGSGKSRLLRALAEIFLCMERGTAIPFPVTLVYDLGPGTGDEYTDESDEGNDALALARHTIYVHRSEQGHTTLIDFDYIEPDTGEDERNWDLLAANDFDTDTLQGYKQRMQYQGDNLPTVYLPSVLLAYTSGATDEWEALFEPQRTASQDILTTIFSNLDREQERPSDWDTFKEADLQRRSEDDAVQEERNEEEEDDGSVEYESAYTTGMGIFVPPAALKFALCAVSLEQAATDFVEVTTPEEEQRFRKRIEVLLSEERRMRGLRGILNEVDWLWPVTIGLRIQFRLERFTRAQLQQLIRLYRVATTVIREPGPEPGRRRTLYFDVREKAVGSEDITTARALMQALMTSDDDEITAFGIFKQLMLLQRQGILEDVTLALQKRTLQDVILYDWLSDGERVFLGRMAFFHLLHKTEDALILLDEAETHFNDFWKREMVDIIDNSLRDDSVEVVLSTHSSIALTDAFDTEIILLLKSPDDGSVSTGPTPIKSFGASPVDIMRDIFRAPESVGQRAAEFLDLMLMIALYPTEVQAVWAEDRQGITAQTLRESEPFKTLRDRIKQKIPHALSRAEDPNEQLDMLLLKTLRSTLRYTRQVTDRTEVTMTDAINALYQRLGPGYYQFEFRRRLQALRRDANAASN